jgi:hypothetical protein
VAGGLVAGVGLLGAWAGSVAGDNVAAATAQPQRSVTVALPRAKPVVAASGAAAPEAAELRWQTTRAGAADRRIKRAAAARRPTAFAEQMSEAIQSDQTAEQSSVEAPAPVAVAAVAPLSNAVIARTIGRIGYACGQVSSTSTVEGAPGVFKVTCSSGQSYRAAPVRGRYHFRRIR